MELLGHWCAAGLQYERFWPLTIAEIVLVLEGEHKRQIGQHDQARMRNYELAHWLTFAQHDPKKMPKFEPTAPVADPHASKVKSDEADQAQVRGFFIGLALKSNSRKR
ncbi:hypothetical protein [Yoonia vestfoldensis]|uniref:Uncharacterized protein n=1 Tax=Yoonia vestfoldensis TaxID=245188 RepID=A0A1Y0EHQ0_9RHOB|nr:hypothetical protein [Yoonia vestfoldensis]ARU02968.1 hypothetical protein LOKVESSMR4R_03702 [Yoonia vestfoldensis]